MEVILLATLFLAMHPQEISGKIISVTDGDTVVVLSENRQIRVRLHGIDCPERGQPFGQAAKERTGELCHGREVKVVYRGRSHNRIVGVVLVDGRDVGLSLLESGHAWHSAKFDQSLNYAATEIDAHEARRGLWVDQSPVEPWVWRRKSLAHKTPPSKCERGKTD